MWRSLPRIVDSENFLICYVFTIEDKLDWSRKEQMEETDESE
jgi:hypothetical protein